MQLFTSCTLVQCGLLASLVSSTITHQGSLASGPDALSRWLDLHSSENDTTSTGGFTPVSARQLFGKRDDVEAGDGALLCPDGECTDGRYVLTVEGPMLTVLTESQLLFCVWNMWLWD